MGGTNVKYIPIGEEVELNLGPASLVEVEPKLMKYELAQFIYDANSNIAGYDEICDWQIEVTNAGKLPIELEITRGFETPYWTLQLESDDVNYEQYDATHARFKLNVEPLTKRKFGYEVTTYHGLRQEQSEKQKQ
jgi:hypothetical protein